MTDEEFGSLKLLKLKYRRENQIIQPFCRIGSPPRNQVPPLKFQEIFRNMRSTAESSRIQSNLMNDEEFKSFSFLKLKYSRGDQIPAFATNFKKFLRNSLTPPASN